MRIIPALCLLSMVACTSPIAHQSPQPSTPAARLASGGVVEYNVPGAICPTCGASGLGAIVATADGSLWFVYAGQQKVGRITTAGAVNDYEVPPSVGSVLSIAPAKDGGVWATAGGGDHEQAWILRISSTGEVTQFLAGTNLGFNPGGIVIGPGGDIWFTEVVADRIGRMTPAGVLTEFSLPKTTNYSDPALGSPTSITAGPDGNLWFTESNWMHPAIARMTPTGAITEYPLRRTANQEVPTDIVVGPDHNLWFAVSNGPALGRITSEGVITTFPLPPLSGPGGLVDGPDGNLWFTDWDGNAIGRVGPTGAIREFVLPHRNAGPSGIAAGRDGRIWFTESDIGRVASIGVTVPEVKFSSRVVNFGASTSTTRIVTVTNTGDAQLSIAAVNLAGPDTTAFSVTADECSGRVLPVRGQCEITVGLDPGSSSGLEVARLQVADNATGSPQVVSLVGHLMGCRLPFFVGTPDQSVHGATSGLNSQGKLLDLTTGLVTDDPNGGFVSDESSVQQTRTTSAPVLNGNSAGYFDQAAGRWLPVTGASSISPDGTRYAYSAWSDAGFGSQIHVVDVATGRDRILNLPPNLPWAVVAFARQGIYVDPRYEGIGPGLWLVNPDSGAMSMVFKDGVVDTVDGSAAWIQVRNPADTVPQPAMGLGGAYNEIVKRDLATGATTPWLYIPGSSLSVGAVANGVPVVRVYDGSTYYTLMVSSPSQAARVVDPETGDPLASPPAYVEADYWSGWVAGAQGTWIGTLDGVYLETPDKGPFLVADAVGIPAGRCI